MTRPTAEFSRDYSEFLDNLPDAVIEVDFATRKVTVMNRVAFLLFGYSPADFKQGIDISSLFTESEYQRAINMLTSLAGESVEKRIPYTRTGRYELWDFEMLKKDGTHFIAETQGHFLLNENRIPVGIRILIRDTTVFRELEISQRRRGNILNAISYTTGQFLRQVSWKKYITEILARLGPAAEVSRVYVGINRPGPDDTLLTVRTHEWVAAGIEPLIDDPRCRDVDLRTCGLERWAEYLSDGRLIAGLVSDFPEREREYLAWQQVRALLIVPIFCDGQWWGQIGFDDCTTNRVWSESTASALRAAAEMIGAVLYRRKVEEELHASQEKYRAVLETIEEGYFELDLNGRLTFVNDALCRLSGYFREELIGIDSRKFVSTSGTTTRQVEGLFNELYRSGRVIKIVDHEIFKKNGHRAILELSASLIRNPRGEAVGFRGIARDVTRRKRDERLLRESEQRFHDLYDNAPDMYFSIRPDGTIISVNLCGAENLGYTKEDLIGNPIWPLIHHEDLPAVQRRVTEVFEKRIQRAEADFRAVDKMGRVIYVHQRHQLVIGEGGVPVELRIICRDISDRKRAEQERESALIRAQQLEKVKSLFLANMSHEIRTPLNAILGFLELIEEQVKGSVSEEVRGFFAIVKRSGMRLMRTIHEILDMSEIEAGTYTVKPTVLNLPLLVEHIRQELLPEAQGKKLPINYSQPPEEVFIEADEYCVAQALTNLLDNAIKYTATGQIDIRLERHPAAAVVTIKDSGIGISREYLQRIFDVFSQESVGYTKAFQGIGLGLALTKRYLDLVGAKIEITSEKGVGTTVAVEFTTVVAAAQPVERPAAAELQPQPEIGVPEGKSVILSVEDDANSRKLMAYLLKGCCELYFATSVGGAKRQIEEVPPDLIFLDLTLDNQENGLELVTYLRATDKWRTVPVIAVTAHAFASDQARALEAGCNDFMTKPIKRDQILEKITTYGRKG